MGEAEDLGDQRGRFNGSDDFAEDMLAIEGADPMDDRFTRRLWLTFFETNETTVESVF